MAAIDYPAELPVPLRSGYGLQHASPMMRTEMQTGRARQRRTYTSVPTMVSASWLLTETQAQLFEAFFRYTISDGTEWFNATLITPMGFKPYECRFAEMYSGPELVGVRHWRITGNLEIRDRQTIDEIWVAYPEWVINSNLLDLAISKLPLE